MFVIVLVLKSGDWEVVSTHKTYDEARKAFAEYASGDARIVLDLTP